MPDGTEYALSEQRNEEIFRDAIVPDELSHAQPQPRPKLVILIAQQGSGKTRTAHQLGARLDDLGGYVKIDSDVYKTYHPDWTRLLSEADATAAAAYTGPDGQRWHNKAQNYAREHRFHVLMEETTQNPPYFAEVLESYRAADFQVELVFLGVPEAMSRQGILHRYHEQVLDRGHGRLTVPEKRDRAYQGMVDTAGLVDEGQLAHNVVVLRRGESTPRYSNTLTSSGQWQNQPRTPEAIREERQRPWTLQESVDFVAVQQRLTSEVGPEWQTELSRIAELADPLILAGLQQTVENEAEVWTSQETAAFEQIHEYLHARATTATGHATLEGLAQKVAARGQTGTARSQAIGTATNALTSPANGPKGPAQSTDEPSSPRRAHPPETGQRRDGPQRSR